MQPGLLPLNQNLSSDPMYPFLDVFFMVFHTLQVFFSLTGWIWKQTRRFHLGLMTLTLLSWFGLGWFYGWGYCPSTDWHWQVKEALGETGLPNSFIKYYLDRLTGKDWDPFLLDASVLFFGLAALGISAYVNWRDWRRHTRIVDALPTCTRHRVN